jgi:hypothetical protein
MLMIRAKQLAVLEAECLRLSLKRLVRKFEVLRPQQFKAMGAVESEAFVHRAVQQGLAWGIRNREDVWELIDLMLKYGPEFASSPDRSWAQGILNSASLSGTAKIKLVAGHLREELG